MPEAGIEKLTKFFFGSIASLGILILALIWIFLVREGSAFFPIHHAELNRDRKNGLDHFHLIREGCDSYRLATEGLDRAYEAEISASHRELEAVKLAYEATRLFAESEMGTELVILRDAIEQRAGESRENSPRAEKLDRLVTILSTELDQRRPVLASRLKARHIPALGKLSPDNRKKIVQAVVALPYENPVESEFYRQIKTDLSHARELSAEKLTSLAAVRDAFRSDLGDSFASIRQTALIHARTTRDQSRDNELLPRRIRDHIAAGLASPSVPIRQLEFAEAMELIIDSRHFDPFARILYLENFAHHLKSLKPDGSAYRSLPEEALQETEAILEEASGHYADFLAVLRTPDPGLDAMLNSIPVDAMPPEQRILLFDLHRLEKGSDPTMVTLSKEAGHFVNPYPLHERAKTNRDLAKRFQEAVATLKTKAPDELAKLPSPGSLQSKTAREELAAFRKAIRKTIPSLEATGLRSEQWKFDRPWTWRETLGTVISGRTWKGNNEFQDFYGIMPLLKGSLIVSIIAIGVSAPVSLAAALYLGQIASAAERALLTPAIKFIGAIPPVVLGYIGIAVLGPMLYEFSSSPLLSRIPGFPLETSLNPVTAGLLLGFMACPIMFTLVSDSLSQVSPAAQEGALALGASPLQIAFLVTLPTTLGGVLASIIIGFSRVIGETMIVLLVVSNWNRSPGFAEGTTEPGHTIPGTLARTLGMTTPGSLDYHAVFMAGLILFLVTLSFHCLGRRIFEKNKAQSETI